jgi:uncharacterized protein (DUF1778 family)
MPDRIRLRVLPQEKQAMQDAAARRGLSLSEFIRQAAAHAVQQVAA